MADNPDLGMDAPSDMQDFPDLSTALVPPPENSYPDKASLIAAVQAHAKQHGYNAVIKTSSTPNAQKPGRIAKVWLRCDRGGTYRPRNGLTEENRKRKRTTRLMNCPFEAVAVGSSGMWTVKVTEPSHNHGPSVDAPRAVPHHKVRRGQIEGIPYDWPHDATFNPFTTALVIIDMQRDFCSAGGYLEYQGFDISATQNLIPKLQSLLHAFRDAGFPIYHTREGHRPDLSTLSSRENHRSYNNVSGFGIGSLGPLGRLLIRGEPGHDIVPELYPLPNEPIIDKPGRSAFAHTDFDLILRNKGIKNLVVTGVTTDVCVSSTVREANDRGYDCMIVEDGVAAADPGLHHGALHSARMEGGIFGVTGKLEDVLQALDTFKHATSKTGNKTPRQSSPAMTTSPDAPAQMTIQPMSNTGSTMAGNAVRMSTPLSSISGTIPMSAGSIAGNMYLNSGGSGMGGGPGSDMGGQQSV